MNYTARVHVTTYRNGISINEQEFESNFNSKSPLTNRREAFQYIEKMEDVFKYEVTERILSFDDIVNLSQNEKNGIYFESSICFFSSCLDDEVNLFNPDSRYFGGSLIHWYQMGLVEELIELYNHMDEYEIDNHVTIDDFGRVILKENLEIVKTKVSDFEMVWSEIINKR